MYPILKTKSIVVSIALLLCIIKSGVVSAQTDIPKTVINTDFTASIGTSALNSQLQYMFSLSASRMHGLGQKHKFQIGYGLRINSYFGNDQLFKSAPSSLAGVPDKEADYVLDKSQVNSLNLALYLQYHIVPKFELGFNIDVIGFSFGSKQTGFYTAPNGVGGKVQSSPSNFNLLLIGNNDLGSLSSGFFVRYWFNQKWGMKAAFNYTFIEYKTDVKLPDNENNDRFRNKATMISLGVTFRPFIPK